MEDIIYMLEQAKNASDKTTRVAKLRQARILFDALLIVEGITPSANKNILHG